MKKLLVAVAVTVGLGTGAGIGQSNRPIIDLPGVERFATLPDGVRFPEGITANPANDAIYVSTFDFGPNPNKLLRFGRSGHLIAQRDFDGTPLLGLAFDASHDRVYIANFGASKVQRIAADFDGATPVDDVGTLPDVGPPGSRNVDNPDTSFDTIVFGAKHPAPNGLVFDHLGNLYVSDSFQGAIFRIDQATTCAAPCAVTLVSHDPLLATAGFPPFGANGLALNADETALFVANTGDNRVLRLDLGTGTVSVFAESVHGADGLLLDDSGHLWVAANQGNQVVALNEKGRVVARVGEFEGIRRDGTPRGLLFPASMVIVGGHMYVTNLALPLTADVVGDEPEEDVTRWTIARVRAPIGRRF